MELTTLNRARSHYDSVRRSVVTAIWLSALGLLALTANAQPGQIATYEGVVARVVDGDTIHVQIGDRVETVRYIGIRTPEMHHPIRGSEPYGTVARIANQKLVEGRAVRLILDMQPRDRYGRLLAYVYVDRYFVNAELVRHGYAEAAAYPPNVRHHADFVELQRQARQTGAGVWGDPAAVRGHKPRQSGVVGVKNVRVFLHPLDPNWMQRTPEDLVYFESAEEARAAGYTHSMDYRKLAAREGQALAGRAEPFVSALSYPVRVAMWAPRPTGRSEDWRVEASEADEVDPSTVVDWLLDRRDKGSYVRARTRTDAVYIAPQTRRVPDGRE